MHKAKILEYYVDEIIIIYNILTYFARYDILYGNLSSIIIMLVWCYFLSYIFVLGMAINASKREQIEFLEETKKLALEELTKENKKNKRKSKKEKTKNNKTKMNI